MVKSIKRFYRAVTVTQQDGSWAIGLDSKMVRTPGGRPLALPTERLASAVAQEWEAQGDMVVPATMPLTQLASTALDRVGPERDHILAELIKYAGTDLLCYRADHPADLAERQQRAWQPILDWAEAVHGAGLVVTTGLLAVPQPAGAIAALKSVVERQEPWRLTAIQAATAAMGSLVLAVALADGRISADEAFALSQVDETYQMELWGEDGEAAERRAALARDVGAAGRLLALLGPI